MADREDFLNAFKAEPENYLHRYVYADWLDERGEHEEADRQRKFEESDKWLREFVKDREGYISKARRAAEGLPEDPYGELRYEDLLQAGHDYADYFDRCGGQDNGTFFPDVDSGSLAEDLADPAVMRLYWQHWSLVTGRAAPVYGDPEGYSSNEGNPFICGCG